MCIRDRGKTGSHKSRLVSHFCSLLIGQFTEEMAGVRKSPKFTKKVKLLYVDTERNQKDQFPFALQEIKKKAGYRINDDVEALDFISLIEVSRTKRLSILKQYLEKVRNESCLLYTSDAADDMQCVDLGGRRIIKKMNIGSAAV